MLSDKLELDDAYIGAKGGRQGRGTKAGLKRWSNLDSHPFDADDEARSLPVVHHVISNLASIIGTYHGATEAYIQSYMDEFCWRYNHRGMKAKFETMVSDLCAHRKKTRSELLELFVPQLLSAVAQGGHQGLCLKWGFNNILMLIEF